MEKLHSGCVHSELVIIMMYNKSYCRHTCTYRVMVRQHTSKKQQSKRQTNLLQVFDQVSIVQVRSDFAIVSVVGLVC